MATMNFGVTLSNRGVLLNICTARDLLTIADVVEESPQMDSVWVGDALFVNRRLDAVTLLAAVAGRTQRILLGPACMGSFALRNPLVLAYEWASLDVLSGGRTRMVACAGGGAGPLWEAESHAVGLAPDKRRKRMVDHIHVLRHLWTKDDTPYESEFYRFSDITLEPKPVQNPCPIWLATNAQRLSTGQEDAGGSEVALKRVARIGDGWMTHSVSPAGFKRSWDDIHRFATDAGRDIGHFDNVLYHHINVDEDREQALADSKAFLDLYYGADYTREGLERWLTYGSPQDCIAHIRQYRDSGCKRISFRLSTMGDPLHQLTRLTDEVLPFIDDDLGSSGSVAA